MALFQCSIYSDALGVSTAVNVIIPQEKDPNSLKDAPAPKRFPVLYLLHGLLDDHTAWLRHTGIERYAGQRGVAVVMPAVGRSFYTDQRRGYRYWTYVGEELPRLVQSWFPVSTQREETFVAGLSMGGYGALKLALRRPERFAAAASFSGAADMMRVLHDVDWPWGEENENTFGPLDEARGGDDDLVALLDRAAPDALPKLYLSCGTEDWLLPSNRAFRARAQKRGVQMDYFEGPGGHDWDFWDAEVRKVLGWLPLPSTTESTEDTEGKKREKRGKKEKTEKQEKQERKKEKKRG